MTTVGSSTKSMTFIGPSQPEQTMRSRAKNRVRRVAQSSRYADRGGDGFGDCGSTDEGVDGHRDGGASTRAGGTTFARGRLVGASTPCRVNAAPPNGAAGA